MKGEFHQLFHGFPHFVPPGGEGFRGHLRGKPARRADALQHCLHDSPGGNVPLVIPVRAEYRPVCRVEFRLCGGGAERREAKDGEEEREESGGLKGHEARLPQEEALLQGASGAVFPFCS